MSTFRISRRVSPVLLAALAVLGLSGCCATAEGNGDVQTQDRSLDDFNELSVDGGLEVRLQVDRELEPSLSVTTDANLLPLINTVSSPSVLDIFVSEGTILQPTTGAFVDVETVQLESVHANNGAHVLLEGTAEVLGLSVNNGAQVQGASFAIEYAEIDANNGGRVVLTTVDAHVVVANGGEVDLCATGDVRGNVRNGGELRIRCGGRDLTTSR